MTRKCHGERSLIGTLAGCFSSRVEGGFMAGLAVDKILMSSIASLHLTCLYNTFHGPSYF